ncbi:MAG: pyridoxal phosphate-dependent aminotransferase [Promethearchaeia archaeon]|nr:MAG: pyridoxal phosphate-dependent aminotransferase [Candidatus Lokiarchaeia archaeon]
MKPLSEAILNSQKSAIRKLFELLLKSSDGISFGIGQPDFTSPDFVNNEIIKALKEHKTQYAPALGLPTLRRVVAQKFQNENKIKLADTENIIITNGGSQALQLCFASLSNPGDEVILSSPNFLSYIYLASYYHLKLVEVPRLGNYAPDLEGIRKAVTPKTKFIIINSPNNPTGNVFTKKQMDELVQIVLENDLYLVSDEVYEKFLYENRKHISPASYDEMFERTLTLNALSKTFGATGLRLGYIAANQDIIKLMEKYGQYTTAGVNHPTQYGAIEALVKGNPEIPQVIQQYNKKRLFVVKRLKELQFEVIEPYGAFYIMPKLNPKWNMTSEEFSNNLVKEEHVACVPGNSFGSYSNDSLRISYATTDELLEEGFNRIERFLKRKKMI